VTDFFLFFIFKNKRKKREGVKLLFEVEAKAPHQAHSAHVDLKPTKPSIFRSLQLPFALKLSLKS